MSTVDLPNRLPLEVGFFSCDISTLVWHVALP